MSRKGTRNFIAPLPLLVHVEVLVLGLNHFDHTLIVKIHNFFSTPRRRSSKLVYSNDEQRTSYQIVHFVTLAAGIIIKYL